MNTPTFLRNHFVERDILRYRLSKSINQYLKIMRVDFDVQSNDILIIDFNKVRKSSFAFLIKKECKILSVSTGPTVSVSTSPTINRQDKVVCQ